MCRPLSSADPTPPTDPQDWMQPQLALPGAEQFISHHGALLGPAAAWFVRTLWAQAAQQAYQNSVQLISHALRYTPQRLERACELTSLHHLDSLQAIQLILAENVDQPPVRPDVDLAGQLRLPFPVAQP